MTKKRPFGIILLAILVGIAALVAVYHTLQFLHILPFSLGPIRFFTFDLIGALLWGITAAIWIWAVYSLWNLRMEGRLFVLALATINLILAILSVIGQSSLSAMLPSIIINIIILVYLLRPGVEKVFAPAVQPGAAAVAPAPAAVPAAMPVEERMAPIPETVLAEDVEPVEAVEPVMAEAPVVPVAVAAVMAGEMEDAEAPAEPEAAVIAEVPAVAVAAFAAMAAEPEEVVMAEPQMEPEAAAAVTMATEPEVAAPVEEKAVEVPAHAARPKVPIDTIEGIGPVYKAKLKELGIETVASLLELGASRKGREELAANSAISEALVLKWVNMADLMRISGVGEEYSELLEAAGVDTVKELRNRNPENLLKAMLEANQQHAMVRRTPHLSEVESWVAQAKLLDPVITY